MQAIFGAATSSFRTKLELAVENLALRHQIGVQLRSKSCSRFAVTAGSFHTLRATGAMKGLEPKVAKSTAWQCMRSVAGRAIVRRRIRDQRVAGSNPVSPTQKAAIRLGKPMDRGLRFFTRCDPSCGFRKFRRGNSGNSGRLS